MNEIPQADVINRVTIVIPVYGHWESLRACVASVIEFANPRTYDVILVNDCGPEADEIEAGLLAMIIGQTNFRYERNIENLGFIRTCNRAVIELDSSGNDILLLNSDAQITAGSLDELRMVLSLSEKHGVACPRSNDATIATIPFFQRDRFRERDRDRTREVFEAVAADLPRYYVSPVSIGFCMLIRRSLIDNHGLFDEIYGMGYNEENDFCLRLNELGYSSLIANHAIVFHVGSTSFGSEQRDLLESSNSRILNRRYPYYRQSVESFIHNEYSALDRFSDLLVPEQVAHRPKILIDLHHLSSVHDGSSKNALSFLSYLAALKDSGAEVVIAAPADAISFYSLHQFGLRVLDYRHIDEVFDLGFALAPVTSLGQLISLNRFCLRWAVSFLDIIALRAWGLRTQVPYKPVVVQEALTHADLVLAISQSTIKDVTEFLPTLSDTLPKNVRVILQGSGIESAFATPALSDAIPAETLAVLADGGYTFVVGNSFPHKQLREALRALLPATESQVVVLGTPAIAKEFPDAHVLPGGTLPGSDIAALYGRAKVVVFPSAYEGFGLPLVEALYCGSPVVAFDTDVTREVTNSLSLSAHVHFFTRFTDLAQIVSMASKSERPKPFGTRTLKDYNTDLWKAIIDCSGSDVDRSALANRDQRIRKLALVWDHLSDQLGAMSIELNSIKTSRSFRLAQSIARLLRPLAALRRRPKRNALQLANFDRS